VYVVTNKFDITVGIIHWYTASYIL